MPRQVEVGLTKAASAAEATPRGLCPGEEGAGGLGWERGELRPAAGTHGTGGQGTRLSGSQAHFAKAGDRRG